MAQIASRMVALLKIDHLPSTLNTKRENEQGYLSVDFISFHNSTVSETSRTLDTGQVF